MTAVHPTESGCRIRVRVQPRASRSEVVGPHGDAVKIRVTAPPVDGAANAEIVRVLAQVLSLPRGALRLAHGHASRTKIVEVTGLDAPTACDRLGLG